MIRAHARVARGFAAAAVDRKRPLMAQIIVTRRCNLACGYCVEWDHTSAPVPTDVLRERIDHIARLRTVLCTLSGGEPLLHPDIVDVVAHVRARGMTAAMNTNALLLTRDRIVALGKAGLYAMQVSIDAVRGNDTTKKALQPLRPRLKLLADHARFRVRINTVLGAAEPEEALEVAQAVLEFGFDAKVSLRRRADGTPEVLDDRARAVYERIRRLEGRRTGLFSESFQDVLLRDGRIDWKCRAGARFFHVCENGLVHLCAPRWNEPGTPIADYTVDDVRTAFDTPKPCTEHCPIAYAHQLSRFDAFRD